MRQSKNLSSNKGFNVMSLVKTIGNFIKSTESLYKNCKTNSNNFSLHPMTLAAS